MAPDETTSQAAPVVQEQPTARPQGGAGETSKAEAPVQEQRSDGAAAQGTPAESKPPASSPNEAEELRRKLAETEQRMETERQRIFREAQSRADKLIHDREMEFKRQAEQQKISTMDDEEYGQYVRQKEAEETQRRLEEERRGKAEAAGKVATVNALLAKVGDPEAQAQLQRRIFQEQEFNSFEAVLDAIATARETAAAKRAAEAEQRKWEKDGRAAAERDATAAQAEQVSTPILGSGTPSGSNVDKLHGHAATAHGVGKAFPGRK